MGSLALSPSSSRRGRGHRWVTATCSAGASKLPAMQPLPEHLTFHSLRHAFASYAAHRGVPISVLSEVMGHSNIGVTQRVYVHLYGREQAEDQFRTAMAGGGTHDLGRADRGKPTSRR